MSRFIKYTLEDGSELLVENLAPEGGVVQAGLGEKIEQARQSFDAALDAVRISALQIRKKLHAVAADEVKVKFGLKATGEAGGNMFAVGKVGVEANYEVTLKWTQEPLPAGVEAELQALKSKQQKDRT